MRDELTTTPEPNKSHSGLYFDPTTDLAYGANLQPLPTTPNPGGSTVFTSATTQQDSFVNTPVSQTMPTFSTTIMALVNGTQLAFQASFALRYSDPAVQAAVAQADLAVAADGQTPGAPSLVSSQLITQGTQTTTTQTGMSVGAPVAAATTMTFGPAVIGPGIGSGPSFGIANADYFVVAAGQTDYTTAFNQAVTINQTVTTTTTLLTQQYDIFGASAVAVPEPESLLLLASGLLLTGLIARMQRRPVSGFPS